MSLKNIIIIFLSIVACTTIAQDCPQVGPIVEGQPVWDITGRIIDVAIYDQSAACNLTSALDDCTLSLQSQLEILISNVDTLITDVSVLQEYMFSQLDALNTAIPITQAQTISVAGNYCVAQAISGTITIAQNNVNLDLNKYVVTGSIKVEPGFGNSTIFNGTVDGDTSNDGIVLNAAVSDVVIENVLIRNALRGLYMQAASNTAVVQTSFVQNTTGMQLIDSYGITVKNTVAQSNIQAGFDLVTSSTNCFIECKALNTGITNNIAFENSVAGFVSANGYGNIFERCIANATQALSTTDSDSLIANFALRGSESCSKIISCEAANATASSDGVSVPHGILLEATISNLATLTEALGADGSQTVISINWSSDGQYLAVGKTAAINGQDLEIFYYDHVTNSLISVVQALGSDGTQIVYAVRWSPDGQYLAVGRSLTSTEYEFQIFQFKRETNELILVAQDLKASGVQLINAVEWSSDGQYLAIGGDLLSGEDVQIFEFDKITNNLAFVTQALGNTAPQAVLSLDWSADGSYLATTRRFATSGQDVEVLEFNRLNKTLTTVAQAAGTGSPQQVYIARWSPDNHYLAVGIQQALTGGNCKIFKFDGTDLIQVTQISELTSTQIVISLDWSSDGNFLALAKALTGTTQDVEVFRFDRANEELTSVAQALGTDGSQAVYQAIWSPDGTRLAIGRANAIQGQDLIVLSGIDFPSKNVIKDNTIYCNGHDVSTTFTGAVGVGISGSSISNMIIGNTAYNNPPPSTSNLFVPSNYYFVANVFNPLFGQAPSDLQNISLNGCDPIAAPDDIGLILKRAKAALCSTVDSLVNNTLLESAIGAAVGYTATPINSATTIAAEGVYCLNQNIDGNILIDASYVQLDLNNYKVTGTISVSSNKESILIKNGAVDGDGASNGILANSGTTNITLSNVVVKNAIRGVSFESVGNSVVEQCTLVRNTTGMQLDASYNIIVRDTSALSNRNAGFDLLSSGTNCFIECKALSTGYDNSVVFDNSVAGFVSKDGYGNIFERCIANATQAPFTTDSNSLIAGFALRGSESCSKIIGCEAANATASGDGVSVPYGILLEGTLTELTSFTAIERTNDTVFAVKWSANEIYLAVGGVLSAASGHDLFVYEFDPARGSLRPIVSTNIGAGSTGDNVRAVEWSPDGVYLAAGGTIGSSGGEDWFIYEFDQVHGTLTELAAINYEGSGAQEIESISWSSDGNFIAVGGFVDSVPRIELFIYRWDKIRQTLTLLDSKELGTGGSDRVYAAEWSPDGNYLAVGGFFTSPSVPLFIYSFDKSSGLLSEVFSINPDGGTVGTINTLNWSADGNYLAIGGGILGTTGHDLIIYTFDRAIQELIQVAAINPEGGATTDLIRSMHWSADGNYLALGAGFGGTTFNKLFVYAFDKSNATVVEIAVNPDGGSTTFERVQTVQWSPDGAYLAIGGLIVGETDRDVLIYNAIQFPSKNVIKDNTVYCNGHDVSATFTGAVGVGISGSSISNMIIGNTAYNNPLATTNFYVGSNYQFVTNVFNELFGQAPTQLQNVSLDGCAPISTPEDLGLILKQTLAKQCSVFDDILTINLLDAFTKLDAITACVPTVISAAQTISTAGSYCVRQAINGIITITANDVAVDLNDYGITGGITMSGVDNVNIKNGMVSATGTSAINVDSNASNITIENVTVRDGTNGILFDYVAGGLIKNCYAIQNTHGIRLTNSYGITIDHSRANCNSDTGFSLVSSATNCLLDCKALATGEGNTTEFDNQVFGFVSDQGYGNIFERCIANATQALSTTDQDSIIAGFALLGTGTQCNKVIECEAANSQANADGVTVPYGIYVQEQINILELDDYSIGTNVTGVVWSPDGQYIGITLETTSNQLQVFKFNSIDSSIIQVAETTDLPSANALSLDWSPDGQFITVGLETNGADENYIYSFDPSNNTLMQKATRSLNVDSNTNKWRYDGLYYAVGYGTPPSTSGNSGVQRFDRVNETISFYGFAGGAPVVIGMDWDPTGIYIARAATESPFFSIIQFDETPPGSVSLVSGTSVGTVRTNGVSWSPFEDFVAAVRNTGADNEVEVYLFDPNSGVSSYAALNPGLNTNTVDWSPDGKLLAVGYDSGSEDEVTIYRFDRLTSSQGSLTKVAGFNTGINVETVKWSSDGQYLAAGMASGNELQVYRVYDFPSKNIIKNNTVYCNTNGTYGAGISGSSIANLIIQNTSYNNPFNYVFVQNVFNECFGLGPSLLQNISLNPNEPIKQTDDMLTRVKRTESLLEAIIDQWFV